MPATAAERGLLDPFDPVQALPKSAEYLKELRQDFGNLGLAAAAYQCRAAAAARLARRLRFHAARDAQLCRRHHRPHGRGLVRCASKTGGRDAAACGPGCGG